MTSPFAPIEATLVDADFTAIADAILSAYPDKDVLYELLLREWGVRVSDIVFVDQAGALAVTALVGWAKAQGRAVDLLAVMWHDRERQMRLLNDLARRWIEPPTVKALGADTRGLAKSADQDEIGEVDAPPIDRNESARAPTPRRLDDMEYSSPQSVSFADLAGALCRVAVDTSTSATGFLIGRRTVLTTHSAVGHAIAGGITGDRIALIFDGDTSLTPLTMAGAAGTDWIGALSQAAFTEMAAAAPTRDTELQLDFAVIRLAAEVPEDRSILKLPTRVPIVPPGDPVVVLHHPMAGPLTTTQGTLIGYSQAGGRVTYEAQTAPGSAGAPVFTTQRDLIALHHAARLSDGGKIGQGVPIWRIRQAIVESGLDPDDL